jgi:P-type Mg2+ transporter
MDQSATYYNQPFEAALKQFNTTASGLTCADADGRRIKYGPNTLKARSSSSALQLFLSQFKSPITIILIAAAILSFTLRDRVDAGIILFIVFVSSALGFWQEKGAADAVNQLLKIVQVRCAVLRDGQEKEIAVEDIVPGDIILLNAGDIIPGDCLLIDSTELFVDEAAFTGETFPVEKKPGVVPEGTPLSKRSNSVFMGSHVISGKAKALVVATAKATEFGKISEQLRTRSPETDFERGIRRFGYLLMEITLVLVILIFATNVLLHKPLIDSFLFSLALAVGLTPQLLPAIITVNLAKGARSMAQKKVIVKRLSAIENFGSMNILCSDKTGTITGGQVTVDKALNIDGEPSTKVLHYAWLNASLQQGFKNPIDEAIIAFQKDQAHDFAVVKEVPYDFIRKRLTIQVSNGKESFAITKGALQQVLDVCTQAETKDGNIVPLTQVSAQILTKFQQLSEQGFRVLGVASKACDLSMSFSRADETAMVFMGFLTLFDPLKPGAADTIKRLQNMGVSLRLITGDNALVAKSLGKQIGLEQAVVLTGAEINTISNAAFLHRVRDTQIFAEIEPNQKEAIILALKKTGNVVGFMGDGINDAAALHAADVGISVDTAVDVAKESADLVLLDHSLDVLIDGIIEGRKTFANTMKYIFMATSANFGNMFSMAGASLFLSFLPLLPKQILLTNLLTDFPETTIATDRVDDVMVAKPQPWDIGFIKRFMITFGILSSLFDYLTFGVLIFFLHAHQALFQTGWFVESVISAALIVLVVRTRLPFYKSLPSRYLFLTTIAVVLFVIIVPFTPLASVFGFVKLPLAFYGWMLLIVACYMVSAEICKGWFYKRMAQKR